jgi:1-acyl-sn-glycerol-3-phosphate acyltransferase
LDPIAIARATPVAAVAKAEILGWPALGAALDDLGVIFVRRGDRFSGAVALRRMMRALDKGVSVLVFPEGTTTFGDEVLPFARGAFGVARLKGVPVVPVTLQYTRRDACWVGNAGFVPHFVSLHRNQRVIAELSFGDPIDPAVFSDPGSLAKAARRSIRELLFT